MKKSLVDMISSADGSISLMRVCTLLVVLAVLFNWCWLTVKTGVKQPLDWDEVVMVIGALTAKAIQRPFETKPTAPVVTGTTP